MKRPLLLALITALALAHSITLAPAEESDADDLQREITERQGKVLKLPLEDQLKLRAAAVKASEDPEVKAALMKRNAAVREYRATVRATMLKLDPTLISVLEKIVGPQSALPEASPK